LFVLLLLFIYFLSKEGWEEGDMGREREKGERGDSAKIIWLLKAN
jgi:hypothetical protein